MADQNINPVGCLGRVLTFIGLAWIGIVVLGSIGLLSEFGLRGGVLAWISGTIIPALLLLAVGRVLRRRARTMEETQPSLPTTPAPTTPGKRVPTSRPGQPEPILTPPRIPGPTPPPPTPPRPIKTAPRQFEPVPPPSDEPTRSLEDVIPPAEDKPRIEKPVSAPPVQAVKPAQPKTSQELVEEARKRWGRKG